MDLSTSGYFSLLAIITIITIFIYRWFLGRSAPSPAESEGKKEAIRKDNNTFRIIGIPAEWDHDKLQSFLKNQESITDAAIESLAPENHGGSQVATVTLGNVSLQHGRSWSIPIPMVSGVKPGRKQYLTVDKDFHGITALYTPSLQDHKLDVIALSGLGGHAFGSFKERGGTHMWLRDSLPFDLTLGTNDQPIARVMIYGYDSTVAESKSMQNIEDFATKFSASLQTLANAATIRPIILIGHSLGGLIIKQALISLSRSENEDDQNLIRAIYGVVFFGTPHDGMDISSLIPMAGDSPNRFLIESINRNNSQTLTTQQRDFHKALGNKGNSEVFCFYETLESPTAQRDKSGNWKMTGPPAVLVTKSSATHCRPWEDGAEHICAINRSHSEMVKFGPHDSDYNDVREKIKGLSRRAFTARDRLQTSRSIFLVPYSQNPNFIIRSKSLSDIKKQFGLDPQEGSVQLRRRVSLYGLGGVGKTQIAIAYVYWLQKTYPDISVFWVHASNTDRFRQSYTSIAKKCNIPGYDEPKVDILLLVKDWLKQQVKMQWLMVIDNADDMDLFFPNRQKGDMPSEDSQVTGSQAGDELARYIPDCNHGSILITTRDKKAGVRLCQGMPPIEIDKMTDGEAHQLVQAITNNQQISIDETSRLFYKLEHLPLALAQAASFIQENDISIDYYVQLLDRSDSALVDQLSESFETVGRDSETPHAVTATWIISFEQIKKKDVLTSEILSILSFFHFQAIPQEFVGYYYSRRQTEPPKDIAPIVAKLTKALGTLKAFCFISEGEDENLNMHRLVQLVTQKWVISQGQMAEFAGYAIETMSGYYPFGEFETSEICLAYLPHANSVLKKYRTNLENVKSSTAKALLLNNMAGYFLFKGEWKRAEDMWVEALEISKSVLGEEHMSTFPMMTSLALAYQNQGQWKKSEELSMQALLVCKKVLGEEHPEALTLMNNLSLTYESRGQWKKAEDLGIQVVKIKKRVLGDEHPSTLTSMSNLTLIYQGQGRWDEAEELGLQTLEIQKRVIGEENPKTLINMANLALVYRSQGQWKKAEDLGIKVLEIETRILGEDHPDTLMNMGNLAMIYHDQRRWKEAEVLGVRLLEKRKRILGEEHPDTATSMNNLALTFRSQGRWKEATDLAAKVVDIEKRVLGEEHPRTLASMNNLALIYQGQNRWKEAEDLGTHVLEIQKRVLREEHPSTLVSMSNLALVYTNQGRWKEVEDLEVQVYMIRKRVLGEEHPSTLTSMGHLATTYYRMGRSKEAEDLLTETVNKKKKVLGEDDPSLHESLGNLALISDSLGHWEKAEDLGQQVTRLRKKLLGEEHPDTLTVMANLQLVYLHQGRLQEAEDLGTQLLEIRKRVLGENHPHTLLSMSNLAFAIAAAGRLGDAIALMEDCFAMRKEILGLNDPNTENSLAALDKWRKDAQDAQGAQSAQDDQGAQDTQGDQDTQDAQGTQNDQGAQESQCPQDSQGPQDA